MATNSKEWLRTEGRHRPKLLVGIADMVGVELDLAIVEVQVRRLVEVAIGIRKLSLVRL